MDCSQFSTAAPHWPMGVTRLIKLYDWLGYDILLKKLFTYKEDMKKMYKSTTTGYYFYTLCNTTRSASSSCTV